MTLDISSTLIANLMIETRNSDPLECCGLLLGEGSRIIQIQPTTNVHATPSTHFEIDPISLIAAHRSEREGGPQILGFYHSHPSGPSEPSVTDREMAAHDGKVWAIIGQDKIKFWRDSHEGFEPLSYSVTEA